MTINVSNIQLLESQRLTDTNDGGGRATGKAVVSGDINNLFQDISRIDRTLGDVSLRKAFVGVQTDNDDRYLGSHVIVSESPEDDHVSLVMFNTDDQSDERKQAQDRIESYVVKASAAPWGLLSHQLEGQRSISAVQRIEQRVPEVGEVYVLIDGNQEQYVRITKVTPTIETFNYSQSPSSFIDLERRKLVLELSGPLISRFTGGQVEPSGVGGIPGNGEPSTILETQIADAARYYGVSKLASDAVIGDLKINVESVYSQLVPSAVVESPLVDQVATAVRRSMVPASTSAVDKTLTFVRVSGGQSRAYLGTGASSVVLALEGGIFTDNGAGELILTSGSSYYDKVTVDYETGSIDIYRTSSYYESVASASYVPAAAVTGSIVSQKIDITGLNRQYNYTLNLADVKPAPGTLVVEYMALGKWVQLKDQGNGELSGMGNGTVNYSTGSVVLSLQALPDAGSAILYSYLSQQLVSTAVHTGELLQSRREFTGNLRPAGTAGSDQIAPQSVTISWMSDSVVKTATDAGTGLLSGDGSGSVNYYSGDFTLTPDTAPDLGADITTVYSDVSLQSGVNATSPDGSGDVSFTMPGAPFLAGSVKIFFHIGRKSQINAYINPQIVDEDIYIYRRDNGTGKFYALDGGADEGTIDYTTGVVTFKALHDYNLSLTKVTPGATSADGPSVSTSLEPHTETMISSSFTWYASQTSSGTSSGSASVTPSEVSLKLLPTVIDPVLPGSLMFTWAGKTFVDRDGVIYQDVSSQTNAGTAVGSVDYGTATVILNTWPDGATGVINIVSSVTVGEGFQVSSLFFRTPGSPIRIGLQITAVRADTGATMTAQADNNGDIDQNGIVGTVDAQTGVVNIRFTSNSADQTSASNIYVFPNSIRYNTVLFSSLPLDADLIGLDPVRLPPDGRVPIYKPGNVVVVSHTASTDVGTPTAGQLVTLTRDHIAQFEVIDSLGVALDSAQYAENRLAGTLVFANPLTLEDIGAVALTPPITVRNRIEHMSVISDVQINGDLTMIAPIAHDFTATETRVSSAIVYGDLRSRLHHWFTQQTWSSNSPVWSNERISNNTTAQFNDVNYPPTVTNKGAISERWALVFTASTGFQIVGEKIGIIGVGSTGSDTAPINPETGVPYFMVAAAGWGTGWAVGNVIRFNTDAALAPLWLARVTKSGQALVDNDSFKLQIRGDAD